MRTAPRTPAFLRRFLRDTHGVAAVEFALSFPLMLMIFFAGEEYGRYLIIQEKVEKVSATISDIVAQSSTISKAQLDDIMNAASQELQPFTFGAQGKVIVSSVTQSGTPSSNNPAKVSWQYSGGGTFVAGSKVGNASGAANMPVDFTMQDKDNVIVTEVFYSFSPLFGAFTPMTARTMYEISYYKPRLGALNSPPA